MCRWLKLTVIVIALVVLYWPGIQHHWRTAHDPYFVPFDASQYIPAFFKFDAGDPIPTTYIKEYFLNVICPPLYTWLTLASARWMDVRHFTLLMMYVQYALFIVVMGRLGWILGGASLSFAVTAMTITAWIFIGLGFIGGAPRMYAFPLISLILYCLIQDRPILLAFIVVLGALLYPVVALVGGFCLASWLLLKPFCATGVASNWSLSRRLTTVGLTGVLAVSALLPMILNAQSYGRRVVAADIVTYPEAGPDGNYRVYDQLPYRLFGIEWTTYFLGPMYSHGDPIVPAFNLHKKLDSTALLLALAITGLAATAVMLGGLRSILRSDQSGGALRCIAFFAACAILHVFSWLAAPYLYIPTRYFMFSLPFLLTLVFPWSLLTVLRRIPALQRSTKLCEFVFLAIIVAYLAAFGGRGNVDFSASLVDKPARPLFDAVGALPKDVVIAGWPVGPIRKLEYVTRRNAFLTGDLHQVLHLKFMQVMRARMDALFDAYFSTDAEPLYRLRDQFGVTHLIVETRDFTDAQHPPEYFAPWRSRIGPRLAAIKGNEYLLNEALQKKTAIFNQNGFVLLDLAKLP